MPRVHESAKGDTMDTGAAKGACVGAVVGATIGWLIGKKHDFDAMIDEDRPVIRVRTGSPLKVSAFKSEFSDGTGDWDHKDPGGPGGVKGTFTVVAFGPNGEFWTKKGSRAQVTYCTVQGDCTSSNESWVTFQAKSGEFVKVKAHGALAKQSKWLLQDPASDCKITALSVASNGPPTAPPFKPDDVLVWLD